MLTATGGQKFVEVLAVAYYYVANNTPHASRKICAPWGVSFLEEINMAITCETIVNEALTLPPAERVAVIDRLLSSLDEADQNLDALWAKEAEARLDAFERGEIRSIPLDDILAKYRDRG